MEKMPTHIAIILDGNRRWAKDHNLPSVQGHVEGAKNVKELALQIFDKGIKYISIFAFSTENFKRTEEEVGYLMNLFIDEFNHSFKDLNKENIKIVFSGQKHPLREDVIKAMDEITKKSKDNTKGTLNICLNYGGRSEIVETTKKLATQVKNGELQIESITEDLFNDNLYRRLPDIDLMIRTGGEYRLSNFMLWQLSYSELFFTDTCFPAFKITEFNNILDSFLKRERRFGGNNEKKNN